MILRQIRNLSKNEEEEENYYKLVTEIIFGYDYIEY